MNPDSAATSGGQAPIKRVGILFAGGPAPGANAVISTTAASFLRRGIEVVGLRHGYSFLIDYVAGQTFEEGKQYINLTQKNLRRTRNSRGILIGTARSNPGKQITCPADLKDPAKAAPLSRVYQGLNALGIDALVSIGGDDTLKTANKLKLYQDLLPAGEKRISVVHVPKTIDNDYSGIDFTFGYFTAVETLAGEIRNLLADAEAVRGYYIAETMGRTAGWLSYGAAIAGEASLVIAVEDITGKYLTKEESTNKVSGITTTRPVMNIQEVVKHIVACMIAREHDGKEFGVIVLAEGLAELLPNSALENIPRDEHGHISISQVNLSRTFTKLIAAEYKTATGKERRVNGLQLGYEARCAQPHAFDVMLGSQLGVGAFRALVEEKLNGVMISVSGQLDLSYVPFEKLVDPDTLVTMVRYIKPNSDFHLLARFLETQVI